MLVGTRELLNVRKSSGSTSERLLKYFDFYAVVAGGPGAGREGGGLGCLQQPPRKKGFTCMGLLTLVQYQNKTRKNAPLLTRGKPRQYTIASARALNDIIREAQAGGATFATIDKLSKDWSEKAGLMRFPEVHAYV